MISATSGIDFALVATFAFFGFFISLILYLRREDRREGYPLEEYDGRVQSEGGFLVMATPKTYILPLGAGTVTLPNNKRDNRSIAARRASVVPGSPLIPTGNAMVDGVGPAAYAERAKVPDTTAHGALKIVPLRVAKEFDIAPGYSDPRGLTVYGADRKAAGTVKDAWVDRSEWTIRYLEVALDSGGTVLLPITMALIRPRRSVLVDAITSTQFAAVPRLSNPDQVTFYEEERVVAYYGGGFLYASPERAEPVL